MSTEFFAAASAAGVADGLLEGKKLLGDIEWLIEQVQSLPDEKVSLKISEWAEQKRSLSEALTENPGPWDNTYAPYTVEIMDRLMPEDPAKDVVVMKGGQTMITTSVIENWLGYIIDNGLGATQYLSGSDEISKNSIELKLDAMIDSADIGHRLKSTQRGSRKLSGNTSARKDFIGGFILAGGGNSTARYRAMGIRNMIVDDLEELPETVGTGNKKQGSLIELIRSRQRAFDKTRKTLFVSTPIFMNGPTHRLFKLGDQREYYCPCKYCGYTQILTFRGKLENGKHYGIYYELEKDYSLINSSVGYRCKNCLKDWRDDDKYNFLNAAEWRPTEKSSSPTFYSYYLDGLCSPEYSWESMVQEWLRCWDSKNKRIRDVGALQTFMNTGRGKPFEERGQSPEYETVVRHRRAVYKAEEIPNKNALEETGSVVLVLTCGVDVHKNRLDVEVKGWCVDSRSYSIEWLHFEGDTSDKLNKPWDDLRFLLGQKEYVADDCKKYRIALTLIDASYATSIVYEFCSEYIDFVYPIMGRDVPVANARWENFNEYHKKDLTAYNVTVTVYKDRLAAWFRRDWNTGELQPYGYPNFPEDYGDDYFRQYEAEHKVQKLYSTGLQRRRFVWLPKDPNNPNNHAWDCAVYNAAALDMLCYQVNFHELEQDRMDYEVFWDYISQKKLFYNE